MKSAFKILLRISVTVLLLLLVFHKVDFNKIVNILKNANVGFFWMSLLCYVVICFLSALRWHYLLLDHNVKVSYFHTLAYYLIGFFYNNFLPTVIGGGVVRAFYGGRNNNKTRQAFSSMLVEIIIGGWALIFYSIVMTAFWVNGPLNLHRKIILIILGIFIVATFAIFLFFERKFMGKFRAVVEKIKIFNIGEHLKNVYNEMYFYKKKKKSIFKVFVLSFIMQSVVGVMNLFVGLAFGFKPPLPIMSYMVYPAVIGVITTIPITINGLGLREWGYKFFFHLNGLTGEQAVILSLMFWFIGVVGSLLGAVAFLFVKLEKQSSKQ